ncbi:MAG: ABC1 kinase family protein, partial [Gammaproteobacteria bacterium]
MARLASGLAGGMLAEGGRRLARGEYRLPPVSQLILTPGNAERLAAQLATLRGAAMKLGQLLSMDAGDILPPALATILARLREDAAPMPRRQLERVLREAWGPGWPRLFADFHWQPVAAASIGQVHRARTPEGREFALKVQYPGVARSIDSDVDNVMALLRLARLLPDGADLAPLVREAKAQLRAEADYLTEAANLERFGELLAGDSDFVVPGIERALCRRTVLAMDFLPGRPIEALATASDALRERAVRQLFRLLFRELFEFRLVQTDPNFANYRVQEAPGRIVLLDFGATRPYAKRTVTGYRRFFRGAVDGDRAGILAGLLQIGYLPADALPAHREKL